MTGPQTLSRPLAARVTALPPATAPPAGPAIPQAVVDAGVQALADGKTKYADRPGILPLRAWVVDTLKTRFDVENSPDEVTITCGETEARFVTIKQLAPPGTQIVCPGDTRAITGAALLAGAEIVPEVNAQETVSMIYLSPNDPATTRDLLLEQATDTDWWIVWDVSGDAETDFHPAQNPKLAPRTVTIGSLSQQMPGWRLGWMAGSDHALKLRAYKQSITICTTSISQWAALGLVSEA